MNILKCLLIWLGTTSVAMGLTFPIGSTPTQISTGASMASGYTSPTVTITGVSDIDIQLVWTGTPTGTFAVNVSEDGTNWDPLTLSSTITASGSAGHGTIELTLLAAPFLQVTYSGTGAGSLNNTMFAKVRQ